MGFKPGLLSILTGFSLCITTAMPDYAVAQLNSGNITQYAEKEGVPGAQVNSVLVDRLGYIWTGTMNGLARYDGYEFKRFYYNPNDTTTMHGLSVWSLCEDRHGKIWIGSSPSFLNAYNPVTKTFRQYNFSQLIPHAANIEMNVSDMCEDNNGRMYFGISTFYDDIISSALLYKEKDEDTLKRFLVPDSLEIQNVRRITKDNAGNIVVFSISGLFTIDTKGKLSKVNGLNALFAEFVKKNDFPGDLKFDKEGHLWIISNKSWLYDLNTATGNFKTFYPDSLHVTNEIFYTQRLVIDNNGDMWVATRNGLKFFNRKTGKFSSFNNGIKKELEHTLIGDLAIDSFGTLWIGSFINGLLKYEDKPQLKSYIYNKEDKKSLTFGWANVIRETSDGKIWIATSSSSTTSGINILDPHTGNLDVLLYKNIKAPNAESRMSDMSAMWENVPGEMYLSSYRRSYSFSEVTHQLKEIKFPGIPDTSIITFHKKDSRENEWICTWQGLYKKQKGDDQYRRYDLSGKEGDASSNQITFLYESKKHGLWILTNNGLFLYNYTTDKIERHGFDKTKGDIFVTQDINSFYEDIKGIAWVGTWQGGLSQYNVETEKIKTYTLNDGLPSMCIQSIIDDEKNNTLWLSTFDGLSRFNLNTKQFSNFSIADGIQGQLFADASFLKTSTGLFVFGGANGITIFNPDDISKNSTPPKVFLTDLKLFNKSVVPGKKSILQKPVYETEQITLTHNQNNISLDFIALHYSNPTKNRYTYKLENYDNEWRDIGNVHVAFYPNLPPGEYTFRVRAANDKGVWNEQGATIKIIVEEPWWKTTWAYILYAFLFILFSFMVNRYLRYRLIQKERQRNQARELEQAKEIEKAYHKLEEAHETLKATQSQLIQSEKMASLGELTAGVAHEIQNPLNFVNNFSEVNKELADELQSQLAMGNLQLAAEITNDIKDNSEKINHHGKRADAIVKGMLQHSRKSSGEKELTDINSLADEYLRLSYHGLRAKNKSFNAKIQTDFDDTIDKINIIPQDIGRVLLNLYNNAFYATSLPSKGHFSGSDKSIDPTIWVSTKKIGDKVLISVRDNGNGIPQSIIDKIFQPFFTTKPTGQGTGLGLSLAYDIIKAHGGNIEVHSEEGKGSEFVLLL
ncbi:MAG: two-component regulator propeller domain-containing protein [Chitinophagaceae bacterium]